MEFFTTLKCLWDSGRNSQSTLTDNRKTIWRGVWDVPRNDFQIIWIIHTRLRLLTNTWNIVIPLISKCVRSRTSQITRFSSQIPICWQAPAVAPPCGSIFQSDRYQFPKWKYPELPVGDRDSKFSINLWTNEWSPKPQFPNIHKTQTSQISIGTDVSGARAGLRAAEDEHCGLMNNVSTAARSEGNYYTILRLNPNPGLGASDACEMVNWQPHFIAAEFISLNSHHTTPVRLNVLLVTGYFGEIFSYWRESMRNISRYKIWF